MSHNTYLVGDHLSLSRDCLFMVLHFIVIRIAVLLNKTVAVRS